MNLGQMRTISRYYLDDTSAERWKDPEMNYYENRAYQYYWNKLVDESYDALLKTPVLLNIVANVDIVQCPVDFYKCKRLEIIMGNRIIPLTAKHNYDDVMPLNGVSSQALYMPIYSFQGTSILLEPLPAINMPNALKLHYWPTVQSYDYGGSLQVGGMVLDSDQPFGGFNQQWHDMIPLRAARIAKQNREEEDVSNIDNDLKEMEIPFYDAIEKMTSARSYVQPFFTGGY